MSIEDSKEKMFQQGLLWDMNIAVDMIVDSARAL